MEPESAHNLENTLESVLFWRSEPITISELAKHVSAAVSDVEVALVHLATSLHSRGVRVIRNGEEVMLGTAPESSKLIEALAAEELSRDLTKAALETLTVILYAGPITRREIDYIRGVNSSFILRNLMIRGLIERSDLGVSSRGYMYIPTIEFVRHLGLEKRDDLPEFEQFTAELKMIREAAVRQELEDNEPQSGIPDESSKDTDTI